MVRGVRILVDSDLALLYGVTTKRLNEQVRRNSDRFPADFAFQLSDAEASLLRSQFATLESGRGRHSKYRQWAFTEHGARELMKPPEPKRRGIGFTADVEPTE